MPLTCPKCNTDLPKQDDLEYRFCPRCGAEIASSDGKIPDNFQTIPPDLHQPVTQRQKHSPQPQNMESHPTPPPNQTSLPDQTIEPEIPQDSVSRPKLVPPPGPPPTSFFRPDPSHPPSDSDSLIDAQNQRPRNPLKLLSIIGAIIILLGGIIYLVLV
jgi:hypothetical protein